MAQYREIVISTIGLLLLLLWENFKKKKKLYCRIPHKIQTSLNADNSSSSLT